MTGDIESTVGSSGRPVTVERTAAASWAEALLTALGAGPIPARQTVDHLLAAEDAGHPSHGLRMLVSIAPASFFRSAACLSPASGSGTSSKA